MANALEKLREYTVVVADTGDFGGFHKFKPQDATTNPSLVYQAAQLPQYQHLVEDAVKYAKGKSSDPKKQLELATDKLFVNFGVEILKIIPGRVSTEVDARLSYDYEGNIKKAHDIIQLYKDAGIDKERVLVKIASTWEGIQAAGALEKEGIHCNMTLLFSLVQAAACAEAKVTLISPFAGRITDFYKAKQGGKDFVPSEDPGVTSVQQIYKYYKSHGYKTVVMGASFRSKEQVIELAGCDLLTIAPKILDELAAADASLVTRKLSPEVHDKSEKIVPDQKAFLWALNQDEMAHFKTAEGIRKFGEDLVKLEEVIKKLLQ